MSHMYVSAQGSVSGEISLSLRRWWLPATPCFLWWGTLLPPSPHTVVDRLGLCWPAWIRWGVWHVHVVINTSLLFSYTPLHITCSPLPNFPTPILLFIFSGHCVWRAHPKVIRGGARGDGTTVLWQWCTQGSLHATTLRKEGRYIHTHSS